MPNSVEKTPTSPPTSWPVGPLSPIPWSIGPSSVGSSSVGALALGPSGVLLAGPSPSPIFISPTEMLNTLEEEVKTVEKNC